MQYQVSRAQVLASAGTTLRSVQIVALPAPPAAALVNPSSPLTILDSASLTGTVLWTAPLSSLTLNSTVQIPTTTSNGLAFSAVPAGVGCVIDFG
jgi:hypothetical protein